MKKGFAVGLVLVYAVLVDVGHQVIRLPRSARRPEVEAGADQDPGSQPAAARANGFGVGSPRRVRVLRSMWEKGASRPGIWSIPSSSYDHVPSGWTVTCMR